MSTPTAAVITTTVTPAKPQPNSESTGLRAHAARWRRRQNRLAIALIVVMASGAASVYVPMRNTLAQTQLNIRTTEAEQAANRDRTASLPQLRATVEALESQVERYKPLKPATDLGSAMQELSEIKERTRPDKYRLESLAMTRLASCSEQPLRLTFEADFDNALALVSQVEAMNRLTRIRDVSIVRQGDTLNGKGGRVNVSMALSLFFSDDRAGAASSASIGGTP